MRGSNGPKSSFVLIVFGGVVEIQHLPVDSVAFNPIIIMS